MIYFLAYLFCEVLVTVEIASRIGGVWTFVEFVLSAMAGIAVIANFRHALAENLVSLQMRQIDVRVFSNRNLMGLGGAALLIVPGFVSDTIGILMLAYLGYSLLINRFGRHCSPPSQPKDDNVIDAEILSDTPALR